VSATERLARTSDAADLARILVAAWRHGYRDFLAGDVLDALDLREWTTRLAPLLDDPASTTIVAIDNGRPIGFARYGPDPDRRGPGYGHLAALYVDPAAAGAGAGRRLVESVIDGLAAAGRVDVSLWVFRDNVRARRLYQRNGFHFDGTTVVDPEWGIPQLRYRRPPTIPADGHSRGGYLLA